MRKGKSKLALAAELVAQAKEAIDLQCQVILLCGSRYSKAEVAALVKRFENLEMVCHARADMALYGLPPAKTGKRVVSESVETGFCWMRLSSVSQKAVTA